jgi:hypothetical protein
MYHLVATSIPSTAGSRRPRLVRLSRLGDIDQGPVQSMLVLSSSKSRGRINGPNHMLPLVEKG